MDSSQNVPYQAYRSKRHSRAISSPPPEVPPSPTSTISNGYGSADKTPDAGVNGYVPRSLGTQANDIHRRRVVSASKIDEKLRHEPIHPEPFPQTSLSQGGDDIPQRESFTDSTPASTVTSESTSPTSEAHHDSNGDVEAPIANGHLSSQIRQPGKATTCPPEGEAESSTSSKLPAAPIAAPRRTTSFRYVPLRPPANNAPRMSSPLRPPGTPTAISSRQFDQRPRTMSAIQAPTSTLTVRPNRSSLLATTTLSIAAERSEVTHESIPAFSSGTHRSTSSIVVQPIEPVAPPQRSSSLPQTPIVTHPSAQSHIASDPSTRVSSPAPPSTPSTSASGAPSSSSTIHARKTAYRPGFQPNGVYRPLTDDFLAYRKHAREVNKIEQTRLERRLEKLIQLHFPINGPANGTTTKERPMTGVSRRASTLFEIDFGELASKSPSELWRDILENRVNAVTGGKNDIRAAEQDITPWENDADVPACPLCSASFHPLTNRKHHCRLCGRIICSLPVKNPQRPQPCSLLFVVDQSTRRIEEVSEGVDYGVRPRRQSLKPAGKGKDKASGAEEKFLKGVRICRECKPIMLRQQNRQDSKREPLLGRLYRALLLLESEIEDALPQFEELLINLSNIPDDAPTKEASAARKRLLEAFGEYDAIAKRIRRLPCPDGPGSSQDRILTAIINRANMFLQKNMFPLQSLPKPKKHSASSSTKDAPSESRTIDPDSELALALQPLLEQEALLESFIEEAKAHRKFEDAKTLKANLAEIRVEIDRIVANANGA